MLVDRAREEIRATVRRQGARLKGATPTVITAALVAAACMPVVWPLLGSGIPPSAPAFVGLFGLVGGDHISEVVRNAINRLRQQDGQPASQTDLQQALERELLEWLQANDERAVGLRVDVADLLEHVHGVEAALQEASIDVRNALAEAFADLGAEFGEFRWMWNEARDTLMAIQHEQARQSAELRHQTDLARETLAKTNLVLKRLVGLTIAPVTVPYPAAPNEVADEEHLPPALGPSPYKGLTAFQAEDAQWFFGREQLVAELIGRLSEKPFLALVGPSGSGKSSVLRAGVLPAVWGGMLPGAETWTTIVLTPGTHPLEELAIRIALLRGVTPGSLLADLWTEPQRLRLAVRQALLDASADARLLLVVDQFEETFTHCRDEAERQGFIAALVRLARDLDSKSSIVLGIRADFYAHCADYPELVTAIQDSHVLIGAMIPAESRRAIEGPAARAELVLEPGLVETVLSDLGEEPGSLPLLSHALFSTWQRRRGLTLTVAGYQDAGGVRQAIAQTAETVYGQLDPNQQEIAKEVFLRLTALGEGTADTRRRARRTELLAGRNAQVVDAVLGRLVEARLVTLDEDSAEVAHEALIREWPRLRRWLNENREELRIHRQLTEAALEWERLGRDPDTLYRGVRLATARDWAESNKKRLNDLERQFLLASANQERDELAAARRRSRRLGALSAVLVVLLVVAVQQRQTARQRGNLAIARQLAAQAAANLDQQPLSLLLSLESLRLTSTDEARATLLQGILEPRHNVVVLTGHTNSVFGVAFSPDSNTIASASQDRTVRRWDVVTGTPIGEPLSGHTNTVRGVAFSPDGKTIASASADHTVRRWDATTGAPIGQPLTGHTDQVEAVAFSPDGKTIASASIDRTVRRWDAATGAPIGQPLIGHTDQVEGVAFSPDGKTVVSGGLDQTVRLWDVATGKQLGLPLTGHTDSIEGVALSPDGKTIASASTDGTVRRWDAVMGKPIRPNLIGHTDHVEAMTFSPDGKTVASVSRDRTVRLWDVATGAPVGPPLTGHTDWVLGVAFGPDGKTVASASADHTVRRWDVATGAPIGPPLTGHTDEVGRVAFSPDGKTVASASADHTVRRWDAATGAPIGPPLTGHTESVGEVAFSPDGKMIASISDDQTVRRWEARTGNPTGQPLNGHTSTLRGVAFSPDGRTIVSVGEDQTVWRWEARTGKPIGQPLTGHTSRVRRAAFSPDGRIIASASDDHMVRLWPLAIDLWLRHACTLAKRNLQQAEWNDFIGRDRPYIRTCLELPSGYGAPADAPAATYHLN
ncbi:MAG: hypothetical protein ACRDZ4_14740 [Egibacteraceae bacterium]